MLDRNIDSIISQSYTKLGDIALELAKNSDGGLDGTKAQKELWNKAIYLESLLDTILDHVLIQNNSVYKIINIEEKEMNRFLACLKQVGDINDFPLFNYLPSKNASVIISGRNGTDGADGTSIIGPTGQTGLATDFLLVSNITGVADSFPIIDAKGARWDYVVTEIGGAQRAGSVIGSWKADGSNFECIDTAHEDIAGVVTDGIEFDIVFVSSEIRLIATITSGSWTISGSRYFIPNNGNGAGPISSVLPNGLIYIGNSSNLAQAQTLSGVISVTNTGISSFNAGVITNIAISGSAAIAVSKLAALAPNLLIATNGSGILTTLSSPVYPTLTQLSYLGGAIPVTLSVQQQLNARLIDPLTTNGDIIIRTGGITTRLGVGSSGQVLTVSGSIPSWISPAAGFADPMSSAGDIIIRNTGNVTIRLGIGSTNQVLTVNGSGIPSWQNPATGFADPMSTVGDIMIRNGSNVTTRLGIGTSGQALVVSSGVPSWQNIGLSGLTSGRVPYVTSPTTISDDDGMLYSAGSNLLTLTQAGIQTQIFGTGVISIVNGSTASFQLNGIGNSSSSFQTIAGTNLTLLSSTDDVIVQATTINKKIKLETTQIYLGNPSTISGSITLTVKSSSIAADLILQPQSVSSGSGIAGTGTILMPSVGIGIAQALKVNSGGGVWSEPSTGGWGVVYVQTFSGGPNLGVYLSKIEIEIGAWNMTTLSKSVAHGLIASKIKTVQASVTSDSPGSYKMLGGTEEFVGVLRGSDVSWNSTNIELYSNWAFFNAQATSTGINRGWITIEYQI